MRITDVREVTQPVASPIRNAYIDFSKMTASLAAVVGEEVFWGQDRLPHLAALGG